MLLFNKNNVWQEGMSTAHQKILFCCNHLPSSLDKAYHSHFTNSKHVTDSNPNQFLPSEASYIDKAKCQVKAEPSPHPTRRMVFVKRINIIMLHENKTFMLETGASGIWEWLYSLFYTSDWHCLWWMKLKVTDSSLCLDLLCSAPRCQKCSFQPHIQARLQQMPRIWHCVHPMWKPM